MTTLTEYLMKDISALEKLLKIVVDNLGELNLAMFQLKTAVFMLVSWNVVLTILLALTWISMNG